MRTTCDAKELAAAIRVVKRGAARKPTLPILEHVLLEVSGGKLTLSATNFAVCVRHTIPCVPDEDGAITAPCYALEKVVRLLDGPTALYSEEDKVHVQNGGTITLTGFDRGEFPVWPEVAGDTFSVTGEVLDRILFAAADDLSRPTLTGVSIEGKDGIISLAAADGFRLSIWRQEGAGEFSALVSAKGLKTIRAVAGKGELTLTVSENTACWTDGQTEVVVSDTIEGTYPDWRVIEPKTHNATACVSGLVDAAKQIVALYGKEANVFLGANGNVSVSAKEDGMAFSQELEGLIEGPAMRIGFGSGFLLDALKSLPDPVTIELLDQHSPAVFVDGDYKHILMPRHIE